MRRIAGFSILRLSPALVLVLGLLLTALVAWRSHESANLRRALRLQLAATQLANVIQARVEIHVALLRATGARLLEPEQRDPEGFREYAQALQLRTFYPGIQGIGFAQRIAASEVSAAEEAIRARGRPDFRVWPEIEGPVGFPIVLLEPGDRRNLAAIGYDMYSEPIRREAMDRAARTGQPAASGRVTLVQEIDDHVQPGFLIYVPVFARGAAEGSPGELVGFSYSPFRANDLFAGMFGDQSLTGVRFAVHDGPATNPETLLYNSDPGDETHADLVIRYEVDVAGRQWTVLFAAAEAIDHSRMTGWWIGLGGLLVTTLLTLLVLGLERERAATARHASELAASEQLARDNQNRKQAIFDAALDGIVTVDDRARITEFNLAAERIFGRSRPEVVGQLLVEVIFPPRFHAQYNEGAERHLATGAAGLLGRRVELIGQRADGSEFPMELSLSRVEIGGASVYTAFVRDITDRIEANARILELTETLERRVKARTAELEDANRQLESFSYSVSHDLRAPARHVLGYAELLKKQLTGWADPNAQRLVRVITESAGRMAHLIDDLLAFSRTSRQELRRQRVEMSPLVEETIRSLAPEIGSRQIEWRVDPLPAVEGDRSLLAQVWTNLLANAVKYTRKQERAVITISGHATAEETTFRVGDNGTGFDMRYVGKLFGVFSRLHREEEFEGTGIGLANVARIVHRHGGRVWAEGEVGVGATFSFCLPRTLPRDQEPPMRNSSREPWKP